MADEHLPSEVRTNATPQAHVPLLHVQDTSIDAVLKERWDRAMSQGVFRYDLSGSVVRSVPGEQNFVVQRNPKRFTHRRVPESIGDLQQPFDQGKFNFTKVKDAEVLLKLTFPERSGDDRGNGDDVDWIIVNVSPICYGHVLYVPSPAKCLPQVITGPSLLRALRLVANNSDRSFCMVANSLLAHASVNHLHYHGLYIEEHFLAKTVRGERIGQTCFCLRDCPVPGFGFVGPSLEEVARDAFVLVQILLDKGIPHNLTIVWGSHFEIKDHPPCVRVLLFPRKPVYGMKHLFGEGKEKPLFFQAALELTGFIPVMDETKFDSIAEKEIVDVLSLVKLDKKEINDLETLFRSSSLKSTP